MKESELKQFIEANPVNPLSSAYINFMMIEGPQMRQMIDEAVKRWGETEEEREQAEVIRGLSSPDEFFKWMRKNLQGGNKFLLREAVLEQEPLVTDMIKKRILTNRGDEFIECAAEFFIKCKENHADWIRQNYKDVRSPYAQSLLCLVLGFRGDESFEEFLLQQMDEFRREFPGEHFDEGPLIAVYMINGLKENLLQK